ncbi:uncharacterized protein M8220_003091 isoform 2-T2 [Acridotheres tristis]
MARDHRDHHWLQRAGQAASRRNRNRSYSGNSILGRSSCVPAWQSLVRLTATAKGGVRDGDQESSLLLFPAPHRPWGQRGKSHIHGHRGDLPSRAAPGHG